MRSSTEHESVPSVYSDIKTDLHDRYFPTNTVTHNQQQAYVPFQPNPSPSLGQGDHGRECLIRDVLNASVYN